MRKTGLHCIFAEPFARPPASLCAIDAEGMFGNNRSFSPFNRSQLPIPAGRKLAVRVRNE